MQSAYHLVPEIMAMCEESDHNASPRLRIERKKDIKTISPNTRLKVTGSLMDIVTETKTKNQKLLKGTKSLSNFGDVQRLWVLPNTVETKLSGYVDQIVKRLRCYGTSAITFYDLS